MSRLAPSEKPVVVSLFSGAGGLDLGLESAGLECRFQTDIDPFSCATLQWGRARLVESGRIPLGSQGVVHCGDVTTLRGDVIREFARIGRRPVVLAGGPPCQAFSVFGKRRGVADPRGKLAFEYLRVLSELKPDVFVFENVYGILSVDGGSTLESLLERLAKPRAGLRYQLEVMRVDAADYGVPQYRDRVFIFGSRIGGKVGALMPLARSPQNLETFSSAWAQGVLPVHRTVRDALQDLPEMGLLPNHTGRVHSARIVDRYARLAPGERDSKTRINRLDLTRPSYTIIVGSDKGGGKGHVHPIEPREVTPRESARMQTFPDWWQFSGSCRHPIRQVGNAVPPLLGYAVGSGVLKGYFEISPRDPEDAIGWLSQEHLGFSMTREARNHHLGGLDQPMSSAA